MNKGQGFAVGAVLAAAILLRPVGSSNSGSETSGTGQSTTNSSAPVETREGPWIASCNYWAPTRHAEEQSPRDPTEIHATLNAKTGQFDLHGHLDEIDKKQELGCSSNRIERWGFPRGAGPIDVTAIIATVSDPVHTHLALTFDRTVDAFLQAASDNNYVSSYYWLPWKNRGGGLKFAESQADAEPGHAAERERQPGLMILKPGTGTGQPGDFYKAIYLFLVAETPTQGVDGFQLQNALLYEAELKSELTARGKRFSNGTTGGVAIIGPHYSGSAASLRAGIETAHKDPTLAAAEFEVTGATSTSLSVSQLESEGSRDAQKSTFCPSPITGATTPRPSLSASISPDITGKELPCSSRTIPLLNVRQLGLGVGQTSR